jgi:hypothetical protein
MSSSELQKYKIEYRVHEYLLGSGSLRTDSEFFSYTRLLDA